MKHPVSGCYLVLLIAAACSSAESETPDLTLGTVLQGDWSVEVIGTNDDRIILGTLTIEGEDYYFEPAPDTEIPSWMLDRFRFFEEPEGEIALEYEPGISQDDDIRTFEDHEILMECSGTGDGGEVFLIRVDQDAHELYFHASISEIQLYSIRKCYD